MPAPRPDAPKPIDHDVVDALGAAADEGDLTRLVDSAAGGDAAALEAELVRLRAEGLEGITLIRAMLRRMALLARLRAEVEGGIGARCRHGVSWQVDIFQGERRDRAASCGAGPRSCSPRR